ncbi:proline-rich domain-containing protein [Actinorugispora endophytica]|uniref:Uncharacterized protein n=1 Tax=Actinorugispora endophytica TaxID=1605990 RepID=A0A4R6V0W6_9ACTN|nr:proline-rich domain-containing protein [Actinorugispora endophytica]TDQ53442.1 hypothetical protein EV190_104232 [Actinorugispora endophytica]
MGHPATILTPLPDRALGWLSWRRPLIGVEPLPLPEWTEPRPDPDAIRAALHQRQGEVVRQQQLAAHNLAFYRKAVWSAVAAVGYSALTTLGLLLTFAVTGTPFEAVSAADSPAATVPTHFIVAGWASFFAPWFAVVALRHRRRLGASRVGWGLFLLLGLGLWFAALAASFLTFGLSFSLLPGAVGLWVLFTRPTVYNMDFGTTGRAPLTLWTLYRRVGGEEAGGRRAIASFERRVAEAVAEAEREFGERHRRFHAQLAGSSPFGVVAPPEQQDIVAVGGSPMERGDMLHHFGVAAIARGNRIWVLDLEGRGAGDRLLGEVRRHGRPAGWLSADDDAALVAAFDALSATRGRRHQITEALASALADDADSGVSRQARSTADTLNRLGRILHETRGAITVAGLHAALEVLLGGGGEAPSRAVGDDFGLDDAAVGPVAGLAPDAAARVRAAFTRQDREHFHAAWTELRVKLAGLLPDDDGPARSAWTPDADLSGASVPLTLASFDRELRAAMLLAHHIELLRWGTVPPPAALAVVGVDRVRPELLRQLSEVAGSAGIRLLLMFNELTPAVRDLARGRRAVAAFGGHGAAAAEELSDLFGKDWIPRLQSYQRTWSEAESVSRAEASGRTWSRTESEQRTRSFNTFSSHGSSGGGEGGPVDQRSSGYGSSTARSHGVSDTSGGSWTGTDTRGTTSQQGGSATTQLEYERRVTGSVISGLAPFTAVLKAGDGVAFIDVKADMPMPPQLTGDAPPLPPPPAPNPGPAAGPAVPYGGPQQTGPYPQQPGPAQPYPPGGGPHQAGSHQAGPYPQQPGPAQPYPPGGGPHQAGSHQAGPYPQQPGPGGQRF